VQHGGSNLNETQRLIAQSRELRDRSDKLLAMLRDTYWQILLLKQSIRNGASEHDRTIDRGDGDMSLANHQNMERRQAERRRSHPRHLGQLRSAIVGDSRGASV